MTNIEALQLVFNASEMAPLSGPDRDRVREAAKQIANALTPAAEPQAPTRADKISDPEG